MPALLTRIWSILLSSLPATFGSQGDPVALPSQGEPRLYPPGTNQDSTGKSILFLEHRAQRDGDVLLAGHRSHSSHRSHASHVSHYSGTSTPSYPSSSSSSTPTYTPPKPAPQSTTEGPEVVVTEPTTPLPANTTIAQNLIGNWVAQVDTQKVRLVVVPATDKIFNVAIIIGRTTYVGACDSLSARMMFLKITGTAIGTHRSCWIYELSKNHFAIQHLGPSIFPNSTEYLMFVREQ